MEITHSHKSGNTKTATVIGAETLAEATAFAMVFWGESERSCWDWHADRRLDGVTVSLFLD